MSQLLVAVFDTPTQAQLAREVLRGEGVREDDLHLGTAGEAAAAGSASKRGTTADEAIARSHSLRDSIGDLFNTLFVDSGRSQEDTALYREALKRGHVALSARVHSDDQAQRVRERLHDLGALDLSLRESQWRAQGWDGGVKPPQPNAETAVASASSASPVRAEGLDDERRHNTAIAALRASGDVSEAAVPGAGFDDWRLAEADGRTVGVFTLPSGSRDRSD